MGSLAADLGLLLLLIAIFLWSLSFYSGHRIVMLERWILMDNYVTIETLTTHTIKDLYVKTRINPVGKRIDHWRSAQISALIGGAIVFVAWRLSGCDGCLGPGGF
jgi:hypothetical protein